MNFLDADVPDPTDFPPPTSAPGLRALDGSFRCDICGELYDAPATIACGHCFCSTCIRSSLSLKQECPSCRKASNEAHIRPNPALESVISSWKEARLFVLGLIKREQERVSASSSLDKGPPKKRKRSVERGSSTDVFSPNTPGPSRHSHLLSPKSVDSTTATPKPHSKTRKTKPKSDRGIPDVTTIPSSDADEEESAIPKPDDLVTCPLCQKHVLFRLVNTHMDNKCKDPPSESNHKSTANSWLKIMGDGQGRNGHKGKHKKRDSDSDDEHPLPLVNYTTLKDRQLKDMIEKEGLSISGSRTHWEQRHRRWVTIFNANLDKSIPNRKKRAELKRDLKKWDDERGKVKKTIVQDTRQYQVDNKNEFNRLIEQAKKTKVKLPAAKPPAETNNNSTHVPNSSSSVSRTPANEEDSVIVVDSEEERLSQQP